jgi:hypothetical protein
MSSGNKLKYSPTFSNINNSKNLAASSAGGIYKYNS